MLGTLTTKEHYLSPLWSRTLPVTVRETTPSRAPHATSDSSRPPSRSLMPYCPGLLLCIAQPPQLAEPAKFEPCPCSPLASRTVCRWPSAQASRVPVVIGGRWRPRAMCGSWHMPPVIGIGWNGYRMSLRRANYCLTRTPIAYLAYEWVMPPSLTARGWQK